jgi:hypothetical protein
MRKPTSSIAAPAPRADSRDVLARVLTRAAREHPAPRFRRWAVLLLRGDAPPGATKAPGGR